MTEYKFVDLSSLTKENVNNNIFTTGRVHNIRITSKVCFLILRKQIHTLQCIAFKKNLGEEKYNLLKSITSESYIELCGKLIQVPERIGGVKSCSYPDFEMEMSEIKLISKSHSIPFQLDDANELSLNQGQNQEERNRNAVSQNVRLNNRYFDLRAPINFCIFKMQSGITQLFREYLSNNDFIEIHSPKLIGTASEGGSSVFPVKYFDQTAYLAQSPQLYKQMAINSDFYKVFEIGPVFRAEKSLSNRHLCEFVGLDIEMAIPSGFTYHIVPQTIWKVLVFIFENLKSNKRYAEEYKYMSSNLKFTELQYPKDPLIIDFKEGVRLLKEHKYEQNEFDDLSTENERKLGEIVKEMYKSDIFVLDKYPANTRPMYTMPIKDTKYCNSFDIIMRGEEICSGAQRIHDYEMLNHRIEEFKIKPETLLDYTESFVSGSMPHAGCGIGLERLLMLYFDLKTVKRTSLYPRDPERLLP